MLCDQPLIDTPYLDRMIDSLIDSDKGIVATAYGDKIGVPAIFGSTYFSQLSELKDDKGARDLLIEYRTDCIILDLDEHQTLDVDSDEDYQQLLKFLE